MRLQSSPIEADRKYQKTNVHDRMLDELLWMNMSQPPSERWHSQKTKETKNWHKEQEDSLPKGWSLEQEWKQARHQGTPGCEDSKGGCKIWKVTTTEPRNNCITRKRVTLTPRARERSCMNKETKKSSSKGNGPTTVTTASTTKTEESAGKSENLNGKITTQRPWQWLTEKNCP